MSILIIGCGYLGKRVAKAYQAAGQTVFATTRSKNRAEAFAAEHNWNPILWDITDSSGPKSPIPAVETVVFAVGFDRDSGDSIEEVYVLGLSNALKRLPKTLKKFIYISSTGVMGQSDGGWVNETSATNPTRPGGKACLQAENLLRDSEFAERTTILRLAGIYGPDRLPYLKNIEQGDPIEADGEGWLNLIHVDDAAAIIFQLDSQAINEKLLLVSDGNPVVRKMYFAEIAAQLNAPAPTLLPPENKQGRRTGLGKRIDTTRLRQSVPIDWKFPTYREGIANAIEKSTGERGP